MWEGVSILSSALPQILHRSDVTPTTSNIHVSAQSNKAYSGEKIGLMPSSTLQNVPASLVAPSFEVLIAFWNFTSGDIGPAREGWTSGNIGPAREGWTLVEIPENAYMYFLYFSRVDCHQGSWL